MREKFRIAFVGNVNCMPFSYAIEVKRLGHEVTFFVDYPATEKLHRPEYRFPEINFPYPSWIKEISRPKREIAFMCPKGELAALISEFRSGRYDAVVLNGSWHKLGRFIPENSKTRVLCFFSGADLDVMASYNVALSTRCSKSLVVDYVKLPLRLLETWMQRRGIQRASLINYYPEGVSPTGDELIAKIMQNRDFERLQVRGMIIEGVDYRTPSNRTGADVRVFNLVRFLWKEPLPLGYTEVENKRNDIMLRGIALFYRETGIAIKVILVEKGAQLAETKALIQKLGISDLITWFKEMTYQDVLLQYEEADIVFDQLGQHFVGGGMDAMLVGRPVIANGRPEVFTKLLGEPIPLCQATNEKEVADWLGKLVMNPELRIKIGLTCREFIINHINSKETAQAIIAHLEARAG